MIPTSDNNSIEARLYRPQEKPAALLPLYIHLHGGGFFSGSIETEDVPCRALTIETNTVVLNLNYRHTPNWKFTTINNDPWDALNWIAARAAQYQFNPQRIVIGGISAGASLALATALRELDNVTHHDANIKSYTNSVTEWQ